MKMKKKEMDKRTDQGKHNHWKTLVLSCSLSSNRETYFSLILIRLIHIVRDRQLDSTDVSPHQKNSCVDEGGGIRELPVRLVYKNEEKKN